jgi:hypothetical protein
LRWIGEAGGAQFGQVQRLLARQSPHPEKLAVAGVLSVQRTRKKIAKWKREGLIECKIFLANEKGWVWLSKRGLEYSGLGDLRYYEPKLEALRHLYYVNQARLYIEGQRPQDTWKSERIIRYEQPTLPVICPNCRPVCQVVGEPGGHCCPPARLRTVRESCLLIRLKPPAGTFPHPASLHLTVGDAPVCDNEGGEGASWKDGPYHHRPDREYDERAIRSLW